MFELLQIGERSPDPDDASLAPKEFPLFLDSSERMRFRYGVFLLNKVSNFPAISCIGLMHRRCTPVQETSCSTLLSKVPDHCKGRHGLCGSIVGLGTRGHVK